MTSRDELDRFVYTKKNAICNKCSNLCQLTINIFNDKKYISGNRCEQGAGIKFLKTDIPNLYLYKYDKILSYQSDKEKTYKYRVGIPLILNMYENIPFWFTFFDQLGCEVVYSDRSSRSMYELGQDSISSDTVCYPAKLVHGHIENIMSKNIDILFYPNMPYNFKEKHYRDNEYNCPVVAFYPEVVRANIDNLDKNIFYDSYLTLNSKRHFVKTIISSLDKYMKLTKKNIENAFDQAYQAYMDFRKDVIQEGERALQYAKDNHKRILLLAGRPYHIDPEIHHGLPKLLRSLDVVVLSEDAVNTKANQKLVKVLNQWTYHTRLYDSAKYISKIPNANLVQLVSFGCGLDAITADEVKSILESHGKVYTQIKIDEVNNLGTANIRIRSLLSTMRGDD